MAEKRLDDENVDDLGLTAKEQDQIASTAIAFEVLERDFREVLDELVGDQSLERFRHEYEKLHQTLKKSHENEKRLIRKCRELNSEIMTNAGKIQTALRLSNADKKTITLLKKEIDKAWKLVTDSQEKERRAQDTIHLLKTEIQNLSELVEQGAKVSAGQESAVNDLLRESENLRQQVAIGSKALEESKARVAEVQQHEEQLNNRRIELEREILSLKEKNAITTTEAITHKKTVDLLQEEMRKQTIDMEERKREFAAKDDKYKRTQMEHFELTKQLRSTDQDRGELSRRYSELSREHDALKEAHAASQAKIGELDDTMALLTEQLRERDDDLKRARNEAKKSADAALHADQEKAKMHQMKIDAEKYRNWLKAEVQELMKRADQQKLAADKDKNSIKDLTDQIRKLEGNLAQTRESNEAHVEEVRTQHEQQNQLADEFKALAEEKDRLVKELGKMRSRLDKAKTQADQWREKHSEAKEQLKIKESEQMEMHKQVEDEKARVKAQHDLYEQVRSERNRFAKLQVQSEDEIAEMRRRFKILTHQLTQLKEEIAGKDSALINEHFALKRLEERNNVSKKQLAKRKEVLEMAQSVLTSQDAEVKTLRHTLGEAESAQLQQKRIYDDVLHERDMFKQQLTRRNDEIALKDEKIKIQQATLAKGEQQYRERLQDIRRLTIEAQELARQLAVRDHEVGAIDQLRNEVYHMQRELLEERTKVKALCEELERPMNVHRWRKLEGSDPAKEEMIEKIQLLQKRLLAKTEAVVEKDLLLKEKEKMYQDIKQLLAKQPGPEISEQLNIYQTSLRDKTDQMKSMAGELNMLQMQLSDAKFEIERLTHELQQTKRQYYQQRKIQQVNKETARAQNLEADPLVQQRVAFIQTHPVRMRGAGFNLQKTALTLAPVQSSPHV